jgi:protein-S-isoprenylcysteine O-methyltransferase Ste14
VPFLAVALAITVGGLALALWARVTLGRNWSGIVTFKENHELIRNGPYSYVRHPIYSAILMMMLGSALAIGTLGALIGLPLILLGVWLKLRQEEALMTKHFPAEYSSYRSQVRALIPGLL